MNHLPTWHHRYDHTTEDAFMVPGMGAQPVPPPRYVAANDNRPADLLTPEQFAAEGGYRYHSGGQYIGLTRPKYEKDTYAKFFRRVYKPLRAGDPNGCADDLVTTTFAPLDKWATGGYASPSTTTPRIFNTEYTMPKVNGVPAADGYVRRAAEKCCSVLYSTPPRNGDFMQTYTGRKFYPLDPKADEVCIEDIAHSLSLQCRYAGHCILFYSVAEHSVLIARWLVKNHFGPLTALHGLLHDAAETYLVDLPSPVKRDMPIYKAMEERVWREAIAPAFGLSAKIPDVVHEVDSRIIADELVNLKPMDWHKGHDNPLGVSIGCWSPSVAEEEFLATYDALVRQVRRGA